MIKETVGYFLERGEKNTAKSLELSKAFAEKHAIKDIVIASTTGKTGVQACEVFSHPEYNVIIVAHQAGFGRGGEHRLLPERRTKIEAQGGKILIATHALAGVDRSIRKQLGTWMPTELFASIFRLFGDGTKVCAEMAMMTADAGLVPVDDTDIITIGGTNVGADTAWVIKPSYTHKMYDMELRKLLCKPATHPYRF